MEKPKNIRTVKTSISPAPKIGDPAFHSRQIDLFQTFLCNTDEERGRLSNTIELWDSVPKYSISRQEMCKRRTAEGFLEVLEVSFRFRGREFTATIQPARIRDEDGVFRDYYPSAAEELVEDAMRKIAAERSQGFFEEEPFRSGVVFTIYQIREELARHGHGMPHGKIVKSLMILSGSLIEIRGEGPSEGFARANFLTALCAASKQILAENPDAKWSAQFHPLVTHSIHALAYRQYDYQATMAHSTQLARWLRRQLSAKFVFASMTTTFEMLWSTVLRDSNLLNYTRERDSIAALDEALAELQAHKAILRFDKKDIKGPRGKILDVRYTLHPSMAFIREMKAANKRAKISADTEK
jgi:hypothetical protein